MISRNIFKTLFLFAAGAALIASCDSEYNDIGADIIEGDIHHNNMERYEGSVVAYDHATGAVQSNNLPLNALGVYDNPVFGKTTAHFVTQLELASENPRFKAPVIDSVYLYVPYFSTFKSTDASTGDSTYELDSIYGDQAASMNLKIYRNGYFLRNTDPGSETSATQKYYSNEFPSVDAARQTLLAELNNFKFSESEVRRVATVSGTPKTVERFTPGIYTLLDNTTFQSAILNVPVDDKLINNNVFKEYFRGLYFNITQNGASGAMANTRFAEGKIVIIYHDYPLNTDGVTFDQTVPKVRKTLTLNMKGNAVNFFDQQNSTGFQNALTTTNAAQGDSRLYVKGGEGSMGVIRILNGTDIQALRDQRVLINEANLVFYVDRGAMLQTDADPENDVPNPLRLYLYDLQNKRPLYDYYGDATINNSNQKYDKYVFGGIREKGTLNGQEVVRYKVRITNHINNIINKDSTNVPLGLVLTENINIVANAALKTPFSAGLSNVETVPLTSVISPLGTVLYGNTGNDVPEEYKLRLEIFYTKPN